MWRALHGSRVASDADDKTDEREAFANEGRNLMRKLAMRLACAFGAALAASTAYAQQEINLTVAAGQALRALPPLALLSEWWVPEVTKRAQAANIKINWKEAYAGSLLKPTMVLEGTRDGITDVGFEPTIFHPDKLPLEQVSFVTPFTTSNVVQVGKAIEHLHRTMPEYTAQYDKYNVVRLAGSSYDSYELFTTTPVKTFEDLKGKKIATAGAALQWLRGTPATPVQSNMMLYYNSAKTGVIDGFIIFPSAVKGMKYPEAAPNLTIVGFGAQYAAALLVNKNSWAKLPPALQKIMRETALEWGTKADAMMQNLGDDGIKATPGFANAQVFRFDRKEQQKWASAMPNIAKEWAERLDKQGLPGSKALAAYMAEVRKAGVSPVRDWDKN
jgi:TRAP-type C4-dicarboxylate transport system substrate-binding protein